MRRKKFKDLFAFLEKKCNFHEKIKGDPESVTWICFHDLRFTKGFCKENNLDFNSLKKVLNYFGGYCDCEVLFNCVDRINEDVEIL